MKGVFIPGITAEMLKSGCLESIEQLMAEGEVYDIDYPQEPKPGYWVHDGYYWVNGCWVSRWLCSECGYKLNGERIGRCPYCEVRMEE